jgi:hypothetical protein
MLLNDCPLEWLIAWGGGGSGVLSLVLYPKCVYFASLTPAAKYWGPDGVHLGPRV